MYCTKQIRRNISTFASPSGLPIVGHVFSFKPEAMHDWMLQSANEVGYNFRVKFGPQEILVVGDPELAEHVLSYQHSGKVYINRSQFDVVKDSSIEFCPSSNEVNGIVFANGDRAWGLPRHAAEKGLRTTNFLKRSYDCIQRHTDNQIERWRQRQAQSPASYFNVGKDMPNITLDVISELAFGMKSNTVGGETLSFAEYARDFSTALNKLLFAPLPYWRYVSSPTYKQLLSNLHAIVDVTTPIVKARYEEWKHSGKQQQLFIDLMFEAMEAEPEHFGFDEAAFNALQMWLAGFDTTAHTLSSAFHFLAQDHEIQEKARAEVLQANNGGKLGYDEVTHLPLLSAVVKETTRLCPIAWVFSRRPVTDDRWREHIIPRDTNVLLAPYLLHRNEHYWDEPHTFRPERFLGKGHSRGSSNPYAWIPFGHGVRSCVGARLAPLEMKIILAETLRNFRIVPNPDHTMTLVNEFFLRPDSVSIRFEEV